jgi:hypothetical protein
MAQSRDEGPSRIELVVLACLSQSKPPAEVEIGEALQQLALPTESADAARRRAVDILAALVFRGWATGDGEAQRGKQAAGPSSWKLTENGKRALRTTFSLSRAPTWAQVRDRHLPSKALGVTPGSERAIKACTESAITAAVLGARFGIRDALTPIAVCDAVIADALGMPRGKLTLDRLRAHVLSRAVSGPAQDAPSPEVRGYAAKLAAWIAGNAVGATGTQRRMARALARRWVCGEDYLLGMPSSGPAAGAAAPHLVVAAPNGDVRVHAISSNAQPTVANPPEVRSGPPAGSRATEARANDTTVTKPSSTQTAQPPPHNLLEVVREAIPRIGADGRFGEKVYVSAIWRTIERDRKAGGLSLDHFKRWLVNANRDGKLVLARADLVGAMDAKQVTESEINDRGATFHFVLDQRNGAVASGRESHAG